MGTPSTIQMASLGMADSLILMVLALVVFGPRRLPQIGRQIGKLMYEFRKASNDFKFQMEEELRNAEEADRRNREEIERQQRLALNPPVEGSTVEAETAASTEAYAGATEDSYPYSGEYGEVPTPAEPTEESTPRIQPPSTGETVAAERPGSHAAVEEPAPESVTAAAEPTEAPAPAQEVSHDIGHESGPEVGPETGTEREPATHNG